MRLNQRGKSLHLRDDFGDDRGDNDGDVVAVFYRIISSNWEIWRNQGWLLEEVTTNMTQKSVRV